MRYQNSMQKEMNEDLRISLDRSIDLIVLAVKKAAMRCKIAVSGEPVTFRRAGFEVPAEILTVKPSRLWRYRGTHYLAGEVESARMDIPALALEPLALNDAWLWDPQDEYWGEPGEPINPYLKPIVEHGPRMSYEMEQILPGKDPEDWDSDPILEASECHERGNHQQALKIMESILTADLRCLDAHAHLGNWAFNASNSPESWLIDKAARHYEAGVRIGELSLPKNFNGVLPWSRIDNRPFLRCLHGYGLCRWRLGRPEEARKVFERLLWLNPPDNQGIRFLLADMDVGRTWYDTEGAS